MNNQCYRSILLNYLNSKKQRNSRFSLRSFARQLKMSPSHLSAILSSNSGLSPMKALEICSLLNLSPFETKQFCNLVEEKYTRKKKMNTKDVDDFFDCCKDRSPELRCSGPRLCAPITSDELNHEG